MEFEHLTESDGSFRLTLAVANQIDALFTRRTRAAALCLAFATVSSEAVEIVFLICRDPTRKCAK